MRIDNILATSLEKQALVIQAELKRKSNAYVLKESEKICVAQYVHSFHTGQRSRFLKASKEFYSKIFEDHALAKAYLTLKALDKTNNPNADIVMKSLEHLSSTDIQEKLPIHDALSVISLYLTSFENASLTYVQKDSKTNKIRSYSFPLRAQVLWDFVTSYGDYGKILKRYLNFSGRNILGNPALYLADLYTQRLNAHKIRQETITEIYALSSQYITLLSGSRPSTETEALKLALDSPHFVNLLQTSSVNTLKYTEQLEQIFRQCLAGYQARLFAVSMATPVRKLLSQMSSWERLNWLIFEAILKEKGKWKDLSWLHLWTEKQFHSRSLSGSNNQKLSIENAEKLLRKETGKKSSFRSQPKWSKEQKVPISPEQKEVLRFLSKEVHLADLLDYVLEDDDWNQISDTLLDSIYTHFQSSNSREISEIKASFVEQASYENSELAKSLIAKIEYGVHRVVQTVKQYRGISINNAIQSLRQQKEDAELRAYKNSSRYKNSPAGLYSKYL